MTANHDLGPDAWSMLATVPFDPLAAHPMRVATRGPSFRKQIHDLRTVNPLVPRALEVSAELWSAVEPYYVAIVEAQSNAESRAAWCAWREKLDALERSGEHTFLRLTPE